MAVPTIIHPLTLPNLLSNVLSNSSEPALLVICLSRATFIRLLLTQLVINDPLLQPTLHLLNTSSKIQLTFCDTVPLLHAYLATLDNVPNTVYFIHPLRLHMHTPAFSAQGLSRTFASLSDAVARTASKMVVVEPVEGIEGEEDPWEQHVPILGSGGKFAGQRGWVGRTVGVRRVVGRWCRFERIDGDGDSPEQA
jgi:hypothetical protein